MIVVSFIFIHQNLTDEQIGQLAGIILVGQKGWTDALSYSQFIATKNMQHTPRWRGIRHTIVLLSENFLCIQYSSFVDRYHGGSIKYNKNYERKVVLPSAVIDHHIYGTLLTAAKKNEPVKNKSFQQIQPGWNSRPFKRKSRQLTARPPGL